MKKILPVLLLAVISASLCSCSHSANSKLQTTTVFVSYDYGRISKGEITTLFNGCFIDFEYKKPDKTLVPGDSITFKHTGYMLSTMSYPGNTQLSGGVIKDVIYSYAVISELSAEKIIRDEAGTITSVIGTEQIKYVIINEDLEFVPLSEYKGDRLFASYGNIGDEKEGIVALFAFNPRP